MKPTPCLSPPSETQPRSCEAETDWRDSPKGASRPGFHSSAVAFPPSALQLHESSNSFNLRFSPIELRISDRRGVRSKYELLLLGAGPTALLTAQLGFWPGAADILGKVRREIGPPRLSTMRLGWHLSRKAWRGLLHAAYVDSSRPSVRPQRSSRKQLPLSGFSRELPTTLALRGRIA